LLGLGEREARSLLSGLHHRGWLESTQAESPDLEPGRSYALSRQGAQALAAALGLAPQKLELAFPTAETELAQRLGRIEIMVGVNRIVAELAAALDREEAVELEDLRALPSRRPSWAWWPADVQAYGCLRAGEIVAPFFIAWDRAGAPTAHRRKRVASWSRFRDSEQPWGHDGIPSILIVCPSEKETLEWEQAVLASAGRRSSKPLPVLLTEVDAVFAADPLEEVWRRAGDLQESSLTDLLAWRWSMPPEPVNPGFIGPLPPPDQITLPQTTGSTMVGQPTTGATEKRLLDTLGAHPLLTNDELAALLRMRGDATRRVLARLVDRGLIGLVEKQAEGDSGILPCYFLTGGGLELLAARDGVPPRLYLRHSAVAASVSGWKGSGRFQTLLRQFEHTVGVNRFFVRLVADIRGCRGEVVRWLSASEASQTFGSTGGIRWLRPDGAADVLLGRRRARLYLEWDRGTMRLPEMKEKCCQYAHYFALLAQTGAASLPDLLLVTTTPERERGIWEVLDEALHDAGRHQVSFLTSVESLVDRQGPLGPVWCDSAGSARRPWPC
jgi:DNA-binding PadR family transcriptional regulator